MVFVDLVGYTSLSERLDPEDLGKLQRTYQNIALETMERYGGFVARFVGDGILIYFGYPRAHEHDAERAVRASLELLQRLRDANRAIEDPVIEILAARAGVHSGLVVVAQELMSAGARLAGVVGEAANLAARIQADAPPGGVLISEDTFDLVEGQMDCEPLGARVFKGISRKIKIYRVRGVQPGARRLPTSFQRGAARMVGREEPLQMVLARWEVVGRSQCRQSLAVVAEAGAGKTRLILELCNRPEMFDAQVLQLQCQEIFSSTPLHPITNFLWARAGFTIDDSPSQTRAKLSALLDEVGLNNEDNREIALSLLGMPAARVWGTAMSTPTTLRRRHHELIIATFKGIARQRRTVLWIEDTHWLDPSTAELLEDLVTALRDSPVLVLLTMRSFPAGPALPKVDEIVHLFKLSGSDCLEIARSIRGAELLPADMLDQAVRSADGIPIFVEQLVMALLDERAQGHHRNRRLGGVPLTLAEILSERLDRLPEGRRIVQAAACIGRSFVPEFLLAVLEEGGAKVARPLEELVRAEILLAKRYGAEIRFEFRHALLQRMAYESMVQTERRAMHGRVVDVLRQLSTGSSPAEFVAHHLTEAGRTVDAIEAWLQAGINAAARSANVEAVDHLRRGIALLNKIESSTQRRHLEIALQVTMVGSIIANQSSTSPELHACCERGLQLCAPENEAPAIFTFAFGEFTYVTCGGHIQEGEQLARRFLSLSECNGFELGRMIGHRMLGMSLMSQGRGTEAREQLGSSLALMLPERDAAGILAFGQSTEVHSKSLLSLTLLCLGELDRSLAVGIDALRVAEALRHPPSTALALTYVGGWVFGLCEATDPMRSESRRLLQLAELHRLAGFRALGTGMSGWALCLRGQLSQGIAALEQAIVALDALSYRLSQAGLLAILADAQLRAGRLRDAVASSRRALDLVSEGSQWIEPEVLRVAALVAAQSGSTNDEVETMLRSAVNCARGLGFPILELRCLYSLTKHLDLLGPDPEISMRLQALAHLSNLNQQVEQALSAPAPGGSSVEIT